MPDCDGFGQDRDPDEQRHDRDSELPELNDAFTLGPVGDHPAKERKDQDRGSECCARQTNHPDRIGQVPRQLGTRHHLHGDPGHERHQPEPVVPVVLLPEGGEGGAKVPAGRGLRGHGPASTGCGILQ